MVPPKIEVTHYPLIIIEDNYSYFRKILVSYKIDYQVTTRKIKYILMRYSYSKIDNIC